MQIPDYYHTMSAHTCFAKSYQGEGSYYCPDCNSNGGSVWLTSDWRPTMFQALCSKCREKYEPEHPKPTYTEYYRLDGTVSYYNEVYFQYDKYSVLKRTAKGVWLSTPYDKQKGKRFVLDSGRKRFAYPTKALALESYIARKTRHLSILQHQVNDVSRLLEEAKRVTDPEKIECINLYFD